MSITMPMPGLLPARKNCSPTTAPMTERPAEMRNPVKIAGSAAGNCSLREPRPRDASRKREQIVLAGSAEVSPNSVLVTIGKNEIMTHTKIAGSMPPPKTESIERDDRQDRHRLQRHQVRIDERLHPLGLRHHDRQRHAEHDRDRPARSSATNVVHSMPLDVAAAGDRSQERL